MFDPRKAKSLEFQPGEARRLVEENERFIHERLRFSFVNDHHGFRPGAMHLLIGRTGAGKSSLTRSLVFDLLRNRETVLYLSTEETELEMKTQMAYSESGRDYLKRLFFIHENSMGGTIDEFMRALETSILETRPKVFVFDNLTTCHLYSADFRVSVEFTQKLRELMQRLSIPFFVIAHTESSIKENEWYGSQHIRGSKLVSNRAEFVYLFFNVMREVMPGQHRQVSLVRIEKSRSQKSTNRVYRLRFDAQSREYISDEEISFEIFKQAFKQPKGERK